MSNNNADYLGTSVGWVKTWKKRLKAADPDDLEVLHARSTARKTPAPPLHALVVERIVQIRLSPPQGMPRVPGARTICTFLQADWSPASRRDHTAALLAHGQQGAPSRRLDSLQIRAPSPADFCHVSHWRRCRPTSKRSRPSPAPPGGKQVNGVECCNFVDAGTSILLSAQVRDDFRAETAFDAVITVMQQYGRAFLLPAGP